MAQHVMGPSVHQTIIIMDFTLYNQAQTVPFSIARETLHILSAHYCERLARCYLVNAPFALKIFLKLLWPFVDDVTRRKLIFASVTPCDSNAEKGANTDGGVDEMEPDPVMLEWIDRDMLEKAYGGDLDFCYDHDEYWRSAEQQLGRS
jgi:hypothetical protein